MSTEHSDAQPLFGEPIMKTLRNLSFVLLIAVVAALGVVSPEARGLCAGPAYCAYYVNDECPLPSTCHFTYNWSEGEAESLCGEYCGFCDWGGSLDGSDDCGWICQCES